MTGSSHDDEAELRRALAALKAPLSPQPDFPLRVLDELHSRQLVRRARWKALAWKAAASALIFAGGIGVGLLLGAERSQDHSDASPGRSASLSSSAANVPSAGRTEVWY
jgi:hypothetical protein